MSNKVITQTSQQGTRLNKNFTSSISSTEQNYNTPPIRIYARKELSLLYFPWLTSRGSATRALSKLIHSDSMLLEELESLGYHKGIRCFTPNMVKVIFAYLGTPEECNPYTGV